jgi:opacity protein-like surface antigen
MFLVCSSSASAGGKPDKDWKDWYGHIAFGYSLAEGDFGDVVDDDFYFDGGATFWPETAAVGFTFDLAYSGYDVKSSVVRDINDMLPPGEEFNSMDVDIWSLSAGAIWGPDSSGSVGFYFLGGLGVDYLKARAKTTGLIYYPPICDPWTWICYPGGWAPGTVVAASQSTTEWSWNAGIGMTFEMASGSQIYVEARYKAIQTDPVTEFIPIVVGFRW